MDIQAGKTTATKYGYKWAVIIGFMIACVISVLICVGIGTVEFTIPEVWHALWKNDDSSARLLIWNLRFPRILTGGLVGVCLSLSGCILQGVMRNTMASPSTMLIYLLAYQKGVSPVKMILSGMAVSALFGAFNDMIKSFFPEALSNVTGFLVGGLNGSSWDSFFMILPYALIGIGICLFLPGKMNILMLGDETANTLGLRTERFRFFLIMVSSILAGAAISAAGLISFVGLIVPHIARLLVGSDYKFLFPASIFLGFTLVVTCDTIGRVIMPPGEIPVSVILSFIGAPFFLYLLRTRQKE